MKEKLYIILEVDPEDVKRVREATERAKSLTASVSLKAEQTNGGFVAMGVRAVAGAVLDSETAALWLWACGLEQWARDG